MADVAKVQTTESDKPTAVAVAAGASTEGAPKPEDSLPTLPAATGAPVDLWDSGWPNGRFFWTVVPVTPRITIAQGDHPRLVRGPGRDDDHRPVG